MPAEAFGAVVISGSHGGIYPGYLVAKAQARAVILNDAGVGKDAAGVESLKYLQQLGIATATVSHLSCRIGDTADMQARGIISHTNAAAQTIGVLPGIACADAARLLTQAPHIRTNPLPLREGRAGIPTAGNRRILLLDSAAMVLPEDAGQIVVTGSHGGLVGGNAAMALRTNAFAAVFSDAGIGIDNAGTTRLPALDSRGMPAFTVSAASARIGDAQSIFHHGIISAANESASRLGARPGMAAKNVLTRWAEVGEINRG
jgi:hypothetical protein